MKRNKAIGYVRSAVYDPTGEVIKRMTEEVIDYCKSNKLDLDRIFMDNGASGNNFNRLGWSEMKDYLQIERGKLRHLVVPDLSRIARNFCLFREEIKYLKENFGLKIKPINYRQMSLAPESLKKSRALNVEKGNRMR
ncbi:recombinase family protein [Pedobacter borealis]|uniref:recombinase family protein n=1 Tax=Pedobacter borealis TaxID=475254 RepID=UPI00049371A4|nr:recombinase family protein [Pedobacter borealis]